jgi:non-heme Fe2+,alpha-ketoglutarate-dependent halogenase
MLTAQVQNADYHLTPAELEQFTASGVIGPFTLLSPEEMKSHWKKLRVDLLDRRAVAYPNTDPTSGVANYDRHLENEFLADLVCRGEIVQRIMSIMGPDLLCWRSEFFPKYPGDPGTDWHQGDIFGGAAGIPQIEWPNGSLFAGTITAWVALTDADVDMSCMQFIPGSHNQMHYDETRGMHYDPTESYIKEVNGIRRGFYGYDYKQLQVDPDWVPDESKAITVPCKAGQFLLFWSTIVHASNQHSALRKDMRMAFVSRYVPTCVNIYRTARASDNHVAEHGGVISLENYGAVLVSGRDDHGINKLRSQTMKGKKFFNASPR